MNIGVLELFCDVDDCCLSFEQRELHRQLDAAVAEPGPKPRLALSEIMTIVTCFRVSHYRSFRAYTQARNDALEG